MGILPACTTKSTRLLVISMLSLCMHVQPCQTIYYDNGRFEGCSTTNHLLLVMQRFVTNGWLAYQTMNGLFGAKFLPTSHLLAISRVCSSIHLLTVSGEYTAFLNFYLAQLTSMSSTSDH